MRVGPFRFVTRAMAKDSESNPCPCLPCWILQGTRDEPKCGFSRQAVALLKEAGVDEYGTFDILQDEDVRQGLKTYSNWPTYPQLYHKGELIGGLDIMKVRTIAFCMVGCLLCVIG